MRVVDVVQQSDEWFVWRAGGITASEQSTIQGKNPHKTPWRLWMELKGRLPRPNLDSSPLIKRGKRKEDLARAFFEERHEEILLPACVEWDENPVIRASLDGINDASEPVELKCPSVKVMKEVQEYKETSDAYQLYWYQVQHQMVTTGTQRGWLCFYCDEIEGEEVSWEEFEILRDEDFIQTMMIPGSQRFWDLLEKNKEPKKDPALDYFVPEPGDDFSKWKGLAEEWLICDARIKRMESEIKKAKATMALASSAMVTLMGDFSRALAMGVSITKYYQKGSIDMAGLVAKHLPDLSDEEKEKFRKKGANRVKIAASSNDASAPRVEVAEHKTAIKKAEKSLKEKDIYYW